MKVLPWPSENDGKVLTSSAFFNKPISIVVDRLDANGNLEFAPNTQIGAIPFTADVLSQRIKTKANDFFYPFDRYELDNYIFIYQQDEAKNWISLPAIEDFYLWSPLPGFDVSFERTYFDWNLKPSDQWNYPAKAEMIVKDRSEGIITYFAKISRSKASYIITALITIFCLTCSIALFAITSEVVKRRRPPSTQVLVWSAATALGEIQLRSLLPGNPRIGIGFDLLIIFPSLFLSIVVVAITSVLWMRRDDFVN